MGIDYRLANKHLGGMSVYLKSLVTKLKQLDHHNEYFLLDDDPHSKPGFKKHAWTIVWEHLWLQFCIPFLFWRKKLDIGYFPNPPVSFFVIKPVVLTIPDVSFIYDPTLPGWTRSYLWLMYFLSAHKATIITTFSENSKADISKFFKIDPAKIYVTPLAASEKLSRLTSLSRVKKDYVITVPGTFIPRKNLEDAILAFKHLTSKLQKSYQLVIVGHPHGDSFESVKKFVANQEMTGKIIFAGRVSDSELSSLYSQAKLFICSSLYEGFGLPILEAMKCGVPVIAYSNSSLPEVVSDAGILVNDSLQLSNAMQRVLENSTLQESMIKKGLKHASKFSWEQTAKTFMASFTLYNLTK